MKFVFINSGTKQTNAGIVRCLGLGEALVKQGHDVIILISGFNENRNIFGNSYKGISFVYSRTGSGKEQISKIIELCKINDINVVHCMGAGSSVFLPALINKLLLGKKFHLVVDYEDKQSLLVLPRKLKTHLFYEKLTYKYADTIICASNELAKEYKVKTKTHDICHLELMMVKERVSP